MKQKTSHPRLLGQDADGKVFYVDFEQRDYSSIEASELTGWLQRCRCGRDYLRPYRTGTQRGYTSQLCATCFLELKR